MFFWTNFSNWGWIKFATAPATATATPTTTTAAAQRQLGGLDHDCCGSTATWWLRPRLRQLGGYDHGNGYDHDCCGSTAAIWSLRFGGYDHGNAYDHDCCGSTTAAITTLAMVTIAAAMATTAEPMGVSEAFSRPRTDWRAPIQ